MDLTDLLGPERVFPRLLAGDKKAIIAQLSRLAAETLRIDTHTVVDAITMREHLGSTGIGQGVALPHARLASVPRPYAVLATLQKRIDFDSIDRQPVDVVLLLLSPDQGRDHLEALACCSRALRDPERTKAIRRADNATELYRAIAAR